MNASPQLQLDQLEVRLVILRQRFERAAQARREVQEGYRAKALAEEPYSQRRASFFDIAATTGSKAGCFERCARELQRVLDGEHPASAGHEWPEKSVPTAEAHSYA